MVRGPPANAQGGHLADPPLVRNVLLPLDPAVDQVPPQGGDASKVKPQGAQDARNLSVMENGVR